jgi:hypothetical protein
MQGKVCGFIYHNVKYVMFDHFPLIDQMDGLVQMVYYLVVSHLYSWPTMFMGGWGMGNIKPTILDVRFNVGGANSGDGWSLLLIV